VNRHGDCQKGALAAVTHVPSSGLLRLPPVEPLAIASHLKKHAASARDAGSVSRNPWSLVLTLLLSKLKFLTGTNLRSGQVRSGQVRSTGTKSTTARTRRSLVFSCGDFELVALCWGPGHATQWQPECQWTTRIQSSVSVRAYYLVTERQNSLKMVGRSRG
jgi:hypothetical protein